MNTVSPKVKGIHSLLILLMIYLSIFFIVMEGVGPYIAVISEGFIYKFHLVITITYGIIIGLLCSPILLVRRTFWKWFIFGVFCLAILTMHFFPLTSRNAFLLDLYSIRIGEEVREARAVMSHYTAFSVSESATPISKGKEPELGGSGTLIYGHSREAEYNGDRGVIYYVDGKVSGIKQILD